MGLTRTIYDWLGNKLSSDMPSTITTELARCSYMELARLIGASYVSAAIQACDIRFYGDDGKRTLDDAAWLWNVSPNQNQSSSQLLDAIVQQMFKRGDSLVIPWKTRGSVSLYHAEDWDCPTHDVGQADHFENISIDGRSCGRDFYASQVYRFDLDATDDKRFSLLKSAVGDQYSRLADSAAAAYSNGNTRRYKWSRDTSQSGTKAEQDKQQAMMYEKVKKFVTSDDIAVWPELQGNHLEPFAKDNTTANGATDFVAIRKDMFELAATCMRMPTSMLYGNVNNFSTVFDSFITFAIDPVAKVIGDEITRKTYTPDEWSHGAHCDLDTSMVKHRDLYDAADDIDKLMADGVTSVNDTLRDFARDPIDEPWADEHLRTKNYETTTPTGGGENNAE